MCGVWHGVVSLTPFLDQNLFLEKKNLGWGDCKLNKTCLVLPNRVVSDQSWLAGNQELAAKSVEEGKEEQLTYPDEKCIDFTGVAVWFGSQGCFIARCLILYQCDIHVATSRANGHPGMTSLLHGVRSRRRAWTRPAFVAGCYTFSQILLEAKDKSQQENRDLKWRGRAQIRRGSLAWIST